MQGEDQQAKCQKIIENPRETTSRGKIGVT